MAGRGTITVEDGRICARLSTLAPGSTLAAPVARWTGASANRAHMAGTAEVRQVEEHLMKVRIAQQAATEAVTPALVIGQFEDADPSGPAVALNAALGGQLAGLRADGDLGGKLNETTVVHTKGRLPADRVLVVGLGKSSELTVDRLRQAVGSATRRAARLKLHRFTVAMTELLPGKIEARAAACAIAEGALLAGYRWLQSPGSRKKP